jgi:FRG domain
MRKTTRGRRRMSKGWLDILEALYADSWNPQLGRFRSRFAYRGVSVPTGALETALARLAGDDGDVVRIELGLLRSFRKYALADAHCADTIWHWLALAQHAGLPTRLLDWTYSPLVALHFATARLERFDQDGEVWCVDFPRVNKLLPRRLRQLLDAEQSEALTVDMLQGFETLSAFDRLGRSPFVVFVEPPTVHRRLAAQHALFSLMPNPTARLDRWLARHPDVYRRVVIPAALKWEIRDKLDQANIHERVLHGGLDGLSLWLARYYRPDRGRIANVIATPRIAK